jgi:phosphoribosylformylglycinamidine synthase
VHGSKKALAITTDCTPRYVYADPVEGGKQAIAEAYRNLCAVGAKPLAVTNCLNFGNPQRPEIMAQFVGALEGMGEACRALDFPVVSGNVSLYNESKATGGGSAILPTPAIGGVGLLEDWEKSATIAFKAPGQNIVLIGDSEAHLGQSLWLEVCHGRRTGAAPPVDLAAERRAGECIRQLIREGLLTAVHDCSDGGLAVAIAEMALASGLGAAIEAVDSAAAVVFGEHQGRYVCTTRNADAERVRQIVERRGLSFKYLGGTAAQARLEFGGRPGDSSHLGAVSLTDLRAAHESFFPRLMGSELTPEF